MLEKKSPETAAAVQTKLTQLMELRAQKAALDELILCMERYALYHSHAVRRPPGRATGRKATGRLAGAA
jgi:hypothetical protein